MTISLDEKERRSVLNALKEERARLRSDVNGVVIKDLSLLPEGRVRNINDLTDLIERFER